MEVALNNEARERDFYLKHRDRTSNPLGKSMFESIANDEAEHYQRIHALHAKLKESGAWPETIPLIVNGTNVKSTLEKVINEVDGLPQADEDDMEAVRIAIDFEQKGVAFYEKLRSSVVNPEEKSFTPPWLPWNGSTSFPCRIPMSFSVILRDGTATRKSSILTVRSPFSSSGDE